MSTHVETVGAGPRGAGQRSFHLARVGAWIRHHLLSFYAALALIYLFLPIGVVVAFSFNNPRGRFNYTWDGFTLQNWLHPFGVPGIGSAIRISIEIAFLSSVAATMLGALMALALVRYQFRGRGLISMLIFLPMATPEIVMGSSLLALFLQRSIATGFVTILIAHIMFNISYVVVTVKARLAGFDRHLEEAAMDLGANEWATFWKVTLPLIFALRAEAARAGDRNGRDGNGVGGRRLVAKVLEERGFVSVRPEQITRLVRDSGSLERAANLAHEYVARAKDALAELPDSDYRRALLAVPDFILAREN